MGNSPRPDAAAGAGQTRDLELLFPWAEDTQSGLWRGSLAASVAIHVLVFAVGLQLRSLIPQQHRVLLVRRRVTPLYLPPDLLMQRERHTGENSKSFDLASLLRAQQMQRRMVAPAPGSVRRLEVPKANVKTPAKTLSPQISAEPPREIASDQPPPTGVPDSIVDALPPAPAPVANPLPNGGVDEPKPEAAPKLVPPKNSVQDVIRQIAKGDSSSSRVAVSDAGVNRTLPAAPGQRGMQGQMHSAIELQTDPQGADFKPYLTEILTIVRRNWFSVLPSSARVGALRGRTTIQFVVNKDGSIPKLIIADSSGVQPLDRAAVAGLSMSNPLPPLPPEFKGAFIRLQFSFNYNVPSL